MSQTVTVTLVLPRTTRPRKYLLKSHERVHKKYTSTYIFKGIDWRGDPIVNEIRSHLAKMPETEYSLTVHHHF